MLRSIPIVLAVFFSAGELPAGSADSYASQIQSWRKDYDRDLVSADGPFTLVARLSPPKGSSSLGRDKTNDLILPVETAPAHAGKIDWPGGDTATFHVESGVTALVDGKAVNEIAIAKPVTVAFGELKLIFAMRDSALRVAIEDANSRMRKEAKPPVWFPVEPRYRIVADWIPVSEPKTIRIPDNNGSSREWKNPGSASFVVDGVKVNLMAVLTPDGKKLSFFFRDRTAGHETYGAGRFLEADLPQNGKVVVDFNKAYNPYCAVNELFICPVPPRENHLPVGIRAGERNHPHAEMSH
ncbi:MAG TPA: DUF1684 domain-containing protein [Bryobacteraceae bacterium]|nr:DUF1684 domain-containing protein [Bryobacteraceae bacterium]